ncbi:MAG: hypothetical protein R2843_04815 [Thermomicrobiales bacterium]
MTSASGSGPPETRFGTGAKLARIGAHAFQHQRRVRPATRAAPDRGVALDCVFIDARCDPGFGRNHHGRAAGESTIAEVADALAGTDVPLLVNTGFNRSNAADLLQYADGRSWERA